MTLTQTSVLYEEILHYDDLEDFKKDILKQLKSQKEMWQEKINALMEQKKLTSKDLERLCGVSNTTVNKWRKGSIPQNRDRFLRIGFAFGLNLEEMNDLLERYGRYPALYIKSLEDCACIFVLQSKTLPHTYETYQEVLKHIQQAITEADSTAADSITTMAMLNAFQNVTAQDELTCFVQEHAAAYRTAFQKFYDKVNGLLDENHSSWDNSKINLTEIFEEQGWSRSLRQCMTDIRKERWIPLRHKVISLALHLNMDTDEINELLALAQMEGLCAKNPGEAALIYAVESVAAESSYFDPKSRIEKDGNSELRDRVREILRQVHLEDAEFLVDNM